MNNQNKKDLYQNNGTQLTLDDLGINIPKQLSIPEQTGIIHSIGNEIKKVGNLIDPTKDKETFKKELSDAFSLSEERSKKLSKDLYDLGVKSSESFKKGNYADWFKYGVEAVGRPVQDTFAETLETLEPLLPQSVENVFGEGGRLLGKALSGAGNAVKNTDISKRLVANAPESVKDIAKAAIALGATTLDYTGIGGAGENLFMKAEDLAKIAKETKSATNIAKNLKKNRGILDLSDSELLKHSNELLKINKIDDVENYIRNLQIDNIIKATGLDKDFLDAGKKKFTQEELRNKRMVDIYNQVKKGKNKNIDIAKELNISKSYLNNEKLANNEIENLKGVYVDDGLKFGVVQSKKKALEKFDDIETKDRLDMLKKTKTEWTKEYEQKYLNKDKPITKQELEDIYIFNRNKVKSVVDSVPAKESFEKVKSIRNKLTPKEIELRAKKEAIIRKENLDIGTKKKKPLGKVEASPLLDAKKGEEELYNKAKFWGYDTKEKFIDAQKGSGVSDAQLGDIWQRADTKRRFDKVTKKGIKQSLSEIKKANISEMTPDELSILKNKLAYVSQGFDKVTGSMLKDIEVTQGTNSKIVDINDSKLLQKLKVKYGATDKEGKVIDKTMNSVVENMTLPNGMKIKDTYRISTTRDGLFQYAMSKDQYEYYQNSVNKALYMKENLTGNKFVDAVTKTALELNENLISSKMNARTTQYSKVGFGGLYADTTRAIDNQIVLQNKIENKIIDAGFGSFSGVSNSFKFTLGVKEEKNVADYFATNQKKLPKTSKRYKSYESLTDREKDYVKMVRDVIDNDITPLLYEVTGRTSSNVGFVKDGYAPLAADKDKLEKYIKEKQKGITNFEKFEQNRYTEALSNAKKGDRIVLFDGLSSKPKGNHLKSRKADINEELLTDNYSDVFYKYIKDSVETITTTDAKVRANIILYDKGISETVNREWGDGMIESFRHDYQAQFAHNKMQYQGEATIRKSLATLNKLMTVSVLNFSGTSTAMQPFGLIAGLTRGDLALNMSKEAKNVAKEIEAMQKAGVFTKDETQIASAISRMVQEMVVGEKSFKIVDNTTNVALKTSQWMDIATTKAYKSLNFKKQYEVLAKYGAEITPEIMEEVYHSVNRNLDLVMGGTHEFGKPKMFQNVYASMLVKFTYPAVMQYNSIISKIILAKGITKKSQAILKAALGTIALYYAEESVRKLALDVPTTPEEGVKATVDMAKYIFEQRVPMGSNITYAFSNDRDIQGPAVLGFINQLKNASLLIADGEVAKGINKVIGGQVGKSGDAERVYMNNGFKVDASGKVLYQMDAKDILKSAWTGEYNSAENLERNNIIAQKKQNKELIALGEEPLEIKYKNPNVMFYEMNLNNEDELKTAVKIYTDATTEEKTDFLQGLSLSNKHKTFDIDYDNSSVKALLNGVLKYNNPEFVSDVSEHIRPEYATVTNSTKDATNISLNYFNWYKNASTKDINRIDPDTLKKLKKLEIASNLKPSTKYGTIKSALKDAGYKSVSRDKIDEVIYWGMIIKNGGLPQPIVNLKKMMSEKQKEIDKTKNKSEYTEGQKQIINNNIVAAYKMGVPTSVLKKFSNEINNVNHEAEREQQLEIFNNLSDEDGKNYLNALYKNKRDVFDRLYDDFARIIKQRQNEK